MRSWMVSVVVVLACAQHPPPADPSMTIAHTENLPTVDRARLHQVSGDGMIVADDETLRIMRATNRDHLVSRYEVCLAENGSVRALRAEQPTGIAPYDYQAAMTIRDGWHFYPYVVDGRAISVCTHVRFDFVMP
jgi:hypothetical protein